MPTVQARIDRAIKDALDTYCRTHASSRITSSRKRRPAGRAVEDLKRIRHEPTRPLGRCSPSWRAMGFEIRVSRMADVN